MIHGRLLTYLIFIAALVSVTGKASVSEARVLEHLKNYCVSAASLFKPTAERSSSEHQNEVPFEPDVYLGQGYSAQVYITHDPKNPHHKVVKKIYKSNEFGDRRYHLDVEGLQALHELSKNVPGSFEVILGERYVERQAVGGEMIEDGFHLGVRLPLVHGRTLQKILNDPKVGDEDKTRLADICEAKLALLRDALEKSGRLVRPATMATEESRYFFEGDATTMKMLKAELKDAGAILIKSDNIIVKDGDPNTMTIIDPY